MLAGAFLMGFADFDPALEDGMYVGGSTLLGLGIAGMAAGFVLIGIGNHRQKRKVAKASYPAAVYPRPEKILCAYPPVQPPWKAAGEGPGGSQEPASTSYSFEERTSGASDDGRARREGNLVREAADEFVARLGAMASSE